MSGVPVRENSADPALFFKIRMIGIRTHLINIFGTAISTFGLRLCKIFLTTFAQGCSESFTSARLKIQNFVPKSIYEMSSIGLEHTLRLLARRGIREFD